MYDFIEHYDDALDNRFCDMLISKFEENPERQTPGSSSSGVNPQIKDSRELAISTLPDWDQINRKIYNVTAQFMIEYVRKYSHLLFGVLGNKLKNNLSNETTILTHDIINDLPSSVISELIEKNYQMAPINLQKYLKGTGGYHKWHSEIAPTHPQCEILHRVLFTIFYLNEVDEGGETEFFYQETKVSPKKGRLVIAPAGFTHTHKGNVPVSNDKYILASWIKFKRYEMIFQ